MRRVSARVNNETVSAVGKRLGFLIIIPIAEQTVYSKCNLRHPIYLEQELAHAHPGAGRVTEGLSYEDGSLHPVSVHTHETEYVVKHVLLCLKVDDYVSLELRLQVGSHGFHVDNLVSNWDYVF